MSQVPVTLVTLSQCGCIPASSTLLKMWAHHLPRIAHLSVPCPLKSPNAPLVLNSLVTLPGGGGSWVALKGGKEESGDPLAPNWGSQGWRPAWDPLASPAVARRTRGTYPLQLPVADGHRGGGRGAVSELGRLPGSQ